MYFAQSERTHPDKFKGLPIAVRSQLCRNLIEDFHRFVFHIENSTCQNKLDADRLAYPNGVGETGCLSPCDHINMPFALSDILPNAVLRFFCHKLKPFSL